MDQSLANFFQSNAVEIAVNNLAFRFWMSLCVSEIFASPKFVDLDYKIEHTLRHVAQFRGNRPPDLGDLVAKKKKFELILT